VVARAFTENRRGVEEKLWKKEAVVFQLGNPHTFCQSPLNTFLFIFQDLVFFVLGISEFDLLCNMLFKPFSKIVISGKILRSNKII